MNTPQVDSPNREHGFVHLVIVALNMLSIAPVLLFSLAGGYDNPGLAGLVAVSFLSWLLLLALTFILVVKSHPHRRIALYGMLITLGLYLFSSLALPAIT